MQQIAIYGRFLKPKDIEYIEAVFSILLEHQIICLVHKPFLTHLKGELPDLVKDVHPFSDYTSLKTAKPDLLLSLGGDGTILDTLALVQDSNIPIAGINLGRLGFLTGIDKNKIKDSLEALIEGKYKLDTRSVLHLESNHPIEKLQACPYALNDCTLAKRDSSSMIIVHAYKNGEFLNSYWADGLIIATPTGSTGYSLSCGGPIIFPDSGNFVITPIAPHNLTVRPMVLSDDATLSFEIEGRDVNYLCTLDSRSALIPQGIQLTVKKADFQVHLVRLTDSDFLSTLRGKLGWGSDSRN